MFLGLVAAVLSLSLPFHFVSAFTYSFGTPSECDNIVLTWTGGTPPFQLLIIPVFATPRNISIPSSAFSDGKGSYTFQLPLAKNSQMLLSMSDATGFNTGGSTNVLTVGASQGGSCNTTDPGISFSFQLNTALQQCRPFVFSGYDQAVQPTTIYAVIPGGNGFTLSPPTGSTSFSWNAIVAQGTSMIFFMTDSQGRQGGSSDVRIVGYSDDSSCLTGSSPTSTKSSPGSSQSAPSTTSSPQSTSTPVPASNTISIAAIAGTVIGGLLFLAVVISLVLFFLKRKRGTPDGAAPSSFKRQSHGMGPGIDLTYDLGQAPTGQPYGSPPNNLAPASNYPYSQNSGAPFSDNAFYDSPPESQYQPSSRYLPPSQFDTASQYSSSRYQFSDTATQYEYNPYQQHPGAYHPTAQLYPPNPNYPIGNPHPVDPFHSTPPPTLSATQSARFSMQTSQPSAPSEVQSNAQRKAAMASAPNHTPSRFIVHTDVEDALPHNEDGIVELPPQYSERRGPVVMNPTSPGASGKSPGGP